jgi:hypothetical protein
MKTGFHGTFVLSWAQTEVDGITAAPVSDLDVGSSWRWSGRAVRVDETSDLLVLGREEREELRRRAAGKVRRLLADPGLIPLRSGRDEDDHHLFRAGFDLTDGHRLYSATLIEIDGAPHPMLLFVGLLPPAERDLWVVESTLEARRPPLEQRAPGVICFVPGTKIATPRGPRPVEELAEDDLIETRDNGPQPLRWIGRRRISGARLFAMPHLRPVRIRADALCGGEPDEDLVVSPDHRVLVKGPVAQALFATAEVLVSARDLINDRTITIERRMREVTYIHLALDSHQVILANGMECESFHPAGTSLEQLDPAQRQALLERFPDVADDPFSYGPFARRNLTRGEAALLAHGGFTAH